MKIKTLLMVPINNHRWDGPVTAYFIFVVHRGDLMLSRTVSKPLCSFRWYPKAQPGLVKTLEFLC